MAEENGYDDDADDDGVVSPALVGWAIAAVVLSILVVTFNDSPLVLGAGFFAKCLAVVVSSVMGLICALVGDALRRFAHPDTVYTSGGMFSLIWIKLFWMIGPQIIGLATGIFLGCAVVLG